MKLEKRKPSGREKNQQAVELLDQLRTKLYCEDISAARRAAFKLAWMQEDGLDILREAMFGNTSRITKTAAAYGLRRMQGRMKKLSLALLEEGLNSSSNNTRNVCGKAILLLQKGSQPKPKFKPKKASPGKIEIKDIPSKTRSRFNTYKNNNSRFLRNSGL